MRTIVSALAAALMFTGLLPVAMAENTPRTVPVGGSVGLTRTTTPDQEFCTGEDGEYTEVHDTLEGSLTSTDPHLNGILQVKGDFLINTTTGYGTGTGTFQIRNSVTGELTVTGRFDGVIKELIKFKGLVVGEVTGGGRLIANLSVIFSGETAAGNLGFPVTFEVADSAVIQVGSCPSGGN